MQLLESLQTAVEREESVFRAQLMREDIGRLQRLKALAEKADSHDEFLKGGLYIGWTPDDLRTHEFKDELELLLDAVYLRCRGEGDAGELDRRIDEAWRVFDAKRLERLVGCLTRVPKPASSE
jgi:hypothetical protein